jgi:hypothetical protein
VLFFEATLTFMWPLKPFLKFVSVKGLVFVAWAQGLFIAWLLSNGYVTEYEKEHMSREQVAEALQDFVICVEMLILAYMHHVAFNVSEFWHPLRGALGNLSPEEAAAPRVKLSMHAIAAHLLPVADLHRDAVKAARALTPRKPRTPRLPHTPHAPPATGEAKEQGINAAEAIAVSSVPWVARRRTAAIAPAAAPSAASAKDTPAPEPASTAAQ